MTEERERSEMKNNTVLIFDTTLRDGEQCPGASMNLKDKVQVAHQLRRLGVDIIEAGFPVISEGDFAAVKQITTEVKGPIIAALARCIEKDIDAAGEAIKPAGKRGRIHVFLATSKIHRESKLNKVKEEILRLTDWGVKRAKTFVDDVEFSPEDASRTESDFLLEVCKVAIAAGATTLNIPDTVGWAVPQQYGALIGYLYNNLPECQLGKVTISVHCHNDLGLAVINSIAGFQNGARQIECTVNGIGERAGNAELESIVMLLKTRKDFFGEVECGIDTRELVRTSRLVSRKSGFIVPRNHPVVGENAFAHASGIHQDGILKKRETYEIMDPAEVGWTATDLPLTKHSGRAAIASRLKYFGFQFRDDDLVAIQSQVKQLGDKKKEVFDHDLVAIAEGHLADTDASNRFKLDYASVTTGDIPTATVRLKPLRGKGSKGEEVLETSSIGDGPVDAAFKAIESLTKLQGKLEEYIVRMVGFGSKAIGEITLRVDFGDGELVTGKGADTDVVRASAQAYVNAVNRFLANGNKPPKA